MFKPGKSGNPGGAPRGLVRVARERHRDDMHKVLEIWARLALGEKVDGYENVRPRDRLHAGQALMDRLIGKPKEHVEITDGNEPRGQPLVDLTKLPLDRRVALLDALETAQALAEPTAGGDDDVPIQ